MELLAGLLLSLTAAVVGVWQVTRRDRPLHGPRDDGTLGLPRLQRWNETYKPPRMQRLRTRFPRAEFSRIAIAACLLIAVSVLGAFVYTRSMSEDAARMRSFEQELAVISAQRQQALAEDDLTVAYETLIDARTQLVELSETMPGEIDAARVEEERARIDAEIQRLSGGITISGVQLVGGFPSPPDGVAPQLVAGGAKTYLLADGIYEIDAVSRTLVQLLKPGDVIDGQPVLPPRTLSWRDDELLAVDAKRAYALDSTTGTWRSEPFAALDADGFDTITAADVFDDNLYAITPDSGQILKFQAGLYDTDPEDWTAGLARDELKRAVDIAVDGRVYVLLEDGTVLNFFRTRLEAAITPRVIPPLTDASAIVKTEDMPVIHVLSASDGRILRIAPDGTVVQQLTTGNQTEQLEGATDLAIDEINSVAYIVTADAIYTVRLPAIPELAPEIEQSEPTVEPASAS